MEAEGLSQSIGTSINCTGGTGDRKGAARRSNRISIARGEEADQDHEDQEHLNLLNMCTDDDGSWTATDEWNEGRSAAHKKGQIFKKMHRRQSYHAFSFWLPNLAAQFSYGSTYCVHGFADCLTFPLSISPWMKPDEG